MSEPVTPAPRDPASLRTIRRLLEQNILDRAVAVSESRWPGSGPLVELAYQWTNLSPAARRERLATIGPEELSRLRTVAELQPDLARVLDDLEARGVIPPVVEVTYEQPADPEPGRADAPSSHANDYVDSNPENGTASTEARMVEPVVEKIDRDTDRLTRDRRQPLPQVAMPHLDIGLPSTSEFLTEADERRLRLAEEATDTLERIRAGVEQRADYAARILSATSDAPPAAPPPVATETSVTADGVALEQAREDQVSEMVELLDWPRVHVFDERELAPDRQILKLTAERLGLTLIELTVADDDKRGFYGALVRAGRDIRPVAGAFPSAAAGANLVVVRGRILPKLIERLRAGFCDIPGTNATVKLHPQARILIITP